MTAVILWLALFGVLCYALSPLLGFGFRHNSRALLPRRAGTARHAAHPVAATPDEGPARPGGTAPDPPVPGAVPLPLPVETPALYNTGAMPRLSEHTEGRWLS